ncbi:MAG: 3-oxoacyl-ACP reductase FabG [Treponema sp.]|jgi:3-oxoacyl-[acyl-carrier protein] reductase/2-hydroxycyclohexanecarboxyl-CoA dehydrogenase|nr:3-oxoacyl-ACP reductase FabG [Treponema sp.]
MGRLDGKVAIVTGAGRGLGKGIALKLAMEGAKVAVADVVMENADSCVREIKQAGGSAFAVPANIAKLDEVNRLFETTVKEFGRLDTVVNNAGINRDGMLHKMSDENWETVIAVNLTGTFYMTREAAKRLREQKSGAIINISSMSWKGNLGQANYAASKAGVVGLTLTAARELARNHVTANVICPGFIDTDMTRSMSEEGWKMMVSKVPMGFAGTPADVGNMAAFLASDEASYITGQIIEVSGGMVI